MSIGQSIKHIGTILLITLAVAAQAQQLKQAKEQRPILPPQITHSQRQGRMAAPQIIMSRNLKYDEGNGDYAFVEFIERIPSNCIEVRYKRKRRKRIELVSYAVYGDGQRLLRIARDDGTHAQGERDRFSPAAQARTGAQP